MTDLQLSNPSDVAAFMEQMERPLALLQLPGAGLDFDRAARLLQFCRLLLQWNASLNLTGARSLRDLSEEHLSDAIVLAAHIPQGAVVVDVGSGGGLPALPLAVLRPDLSLVLVEPRHKRVAFLRTAVRSLALGAEVFAGRVEDWPGKAQVALSRATFSPEAWVPMGLQLVVPGGVVYALLNQRYAGEPLAQHAPAGSHPYRLPRGQERTLAWFVSTDVPRGTS